MNTTSVTHSHNVRVVSFTAILTLVFAFSAWALAAIGGFSPSVTVLTLVVSAFAASWIVTGHSSNSHGLVVRSRVR